DPGEDQGTLERRATSRLSLLPRFRPDRGWSRRAGAARLLRDAARRDQDDEGDRRSNSTSEVKLWRSRPIASTKCPQRSANLDIAPAESSASNIKSNFCAKEKDAEGVTACSGLRDIRHVDAEGDRTLVAVGVTCDPGTDRV